MFVFKEEDLLEYATQEDVYKHCNEYDLFRYYIGDFKLNKTMLSPLRKEHSASFSIFASGGRILFKDFLLGSGNIIKFVMLKFNYSSYREAINRIIHDAGLSNQFRTDLIYTPKPVIKYNKKIDTIKNTVSIRTRKSQQYDLEFWQQFGITRETLNKYRVVPISHFFLNNICIKADKYAYSFIEKKDNESSYTIYQPFSENYKWAKSHDSSVFYGWSQLPSSGDRLIITKSMKDVMTINSLTGLPTVAMQNEVVKPKQHVINDLKNRFKECYLLYDNDWANAAKGKPNYGREFGKLIAKEFGIKQIEIPDFIAEKYNAKDMSDLAKNSEHEYVRIMLLDDIYNYEVAN